MLRLSPWFKKLFIAFSINIIAWECIIRLFISSPCTQVTDNILGYMNAPCANFVYSSEGYSRDHFNSIGFNDEEPKVAANIKRVFVVGDSYTESFQVARKDSFVQLLEDGLNDKMSSGKIDVIKLGRDGFNPAYYPLVIDRFAQKFSPDLIVLQFWTHSGGDLYSSNIFCEYDKEGKIISLALLKSTAEKGKDALRIIIKNSALIYYALRRYKPYIMQTVHWFSSIGAKPAKPVSSKKQRSLFDLEQRFSFIFDKILRQNTKLLVFYIPRPGIFFRSGNEQTSDTLQALRATAKAKGITLIDLTESVRESYIKNANPLNGFTNTLPGKGHLNVRGHSIVAHKLLTYFKEQKILP